jgi:hypothetical protein
MKNQSIWKKNVGHLINATENFAKGNIGMRNYKAVIKMISADFKNIDFKYHKTLDTYILNFVFEFNNAYPILLDLQVDTKTKEADVINIQQ